MSEENKVEGAEAEAAAAEAQGADEAERARIWEELQAEQAGQATGTPAPADEAKPDKDAAEAGQVEKAGTPEGQAAADTPPEDAGKPPASKDSTDDLWKDAPEPLRKAFEAERDARVRAENVVKVHGGRLTQAYRERDALNAKLEEIGKGAPPQEGGESDEDYRKRMTDEFPDFQRLFTDLDAAKAKIATLESTQTTQASAQTEEALQRQQAILEEAHPTYQEDVKAPAFLEWAERQPGYVQDAIRLNAREIVDGSSAADILSRYKRETAPADEAKQREEERRKEQLEAARAVDTRTPGTPAGKGEQTEQQIWDELKEQERRKAQQK